MLLKGYGKEMYLMSQKDTFQIAYLLYKVKYIRWNFLIYVKVWKNDSCL